VLGIRLGRSVGQPVRDSSKPKASSRSDIGLPSSMRDADI
jgi:hypothetical protein